MKRKFSQLASSGLSVSSSFSARFAVLIAAVGLLVLAASATAGDEENDAEIQRLQGRYERTFQNAAGTMFRVVKEVTGDQTTVTTYDDVGNVIEAHTSSFKTQKRGEVRIWSFFNVLVTAGPGKGHQQLETRSFLYRADDATCTEAWGLLEGDPSSPRMFLWKRVK